MRVRYVTCPDDSIQDIEDFIEPYVNEVIEDDEVIIRSNDEETITLATQGGLVDIDVRVAEGVMKANERLRNNKEGNTEDVLTNDKVEIIDKKKEEKSKGEDESEDENITDRSRAQENNNDDKAEGKIDEKDKVEEVVEDSSKDGRSDEEKDKKR